MQFFELTEALSEVPGVEVAVRRGLVSIHIPALGDTARLDPDEVRSAESVFVPTRLPAVQLDLRLGHEILPLIVTVDDFVFTPVYADDLVEKGAYRKLPAMPNLISYSEMHRDVRALGKAIDDATLDLDPETLAATLLAHRCFLAGAMRAGLWPVRVAAWWEYANARVGGPVGVAPLRADPDWDDLMADVTEARRQTADQSARTAQQSAETAQQPAQTAQQSAQTTQPSPRVTARPTRAGEPSAQPAAPQQATRFRISEGSLQPIPAED